MYRSTTLIATYCRYLLTFYLTYFEISIEIYESVYEYEYTQSFQLDAIVGKE